MMNSDKKTFFRNFLAFIASLLCGTVAGSLAALIIGRIPIHIHVVFAATIAFIAVIPTGSVWHRLRVSHLDPPNGNVLLNRSGLQVPVFLACFLAACFSYLSFHWWDYIIFLGKTDVGVHTYLFQQTGHSGFLGFMKLKASQPFSTFGILHGIPVRSSSGGQSMPFYHWLMWSLDFFIVLVIGLVGGEVSENMNSGDSLPIKK